MSNNKSDLKPYYQNAKKILMEEFQKDQEIKSYPLFSNLLGSTILKSFFEKCNNNKQKKL